MTTGALPPYFDPRTGRSASLVRSATILAPPRRARWLIKVAFVLGAKRADLYNRLPDVDAIIVTPDGKEHYTKGIESVKPAK